MSDSLFLITVLLIGLATLLCRGILIVPSGAHHVSKRFEGLLEFIPVSATAAIAMSSLVYDGGDYTIAPERLIGGIAAFGVAYFSKSAVMTIILGMAVLWMLNIWVV